MIVGLGIDAIDIDRIARMYADKGDRMLQRLFRPAWNKQNGIPLQDALPYQLPFAADRHLA